MKIATLQPCRDWLDDNVAVGSVGSPFFLVAIFGLGVLICSVNRLQCVVSGHMK